MVTEALEDWTLTEVTKKVVGKVHTVRGQDSFGLDNTLDLLKKLPRPVMMLAMWGFQTSGIELLEASTTWFELGGMQFNAYSSVQFSVNGKGWSTDFKTIARDTAYDEKE